MKNNLKDNFSFLKDKSILVISDDNNIIQKIKHSLDTQVGKASYFDSFYNIDYLSTYDLIIIDIDQTNLERIENELNSEEIKTPVIYLANEINMKILDYSKKITLGFENTFHSFHYFLQLYLPNII